MQTTPLSLVLGVDVGTSGLRAVLLDRDGGFVDEATSEYELRSPQPGWAEQDPDRWFAALRDALAMLWARGYSGSQVSAIGLTGQMHSIVVLDEDGGVVCPALLRCAQRTGAECLEITERIGAERLLERTGNVALAGFTAPKILWIRRHWPEAFARAAHLLLPKDFIRQRLTGAFVTEMSDASGQ